MATQGAEEMIEAVYSMNDGNDALEQFHERHNVNSLLILTITSAYAATREVDRFASQIRGKTVIEVGAGVGFMSVEMAKFAKRVYAIEADPSWSWIFTQTLYGVKPPNLTWIFGTAESVADVLRGDVAVVYTRSAREEMEAVAGKMCPLVIAGPTLSIDDLHPEIPPELREAAKKFSETITPNDLASRRGISPEAIETAAKEMAAKYYKP